MAATKRAYKLQEFVAHSSNVNCLKIGRRTSRVLVTGGEDHKVNLWAIGKPNAILSLAGHTSAVESVCFDSSEVLVAAGATNGTIKLWDLEEAKVVRTLTGHRSNCVSVDFHPFGEFLASGSLDTNLKIWDIRRKSCIHTYKGHTRGVNAIRFTPDGRWVVSGGEDNIVKLWDLTAGKLLHDFKCHEGQIQCIDFHPHEFLLATGSADRTVKFWDLETFELVGSVGPEITGVRSMTFNPDGRTLLCGLHETLKVLSWEPIRCHDAVDVGWSRLSDLNIHEGKLLGCSHNQSCVGVWVVDLSHIKPYAVASAARSNGHSESKSTSSGNLSLQAGNNLKTSVGRISVSQNSELVVKEAKPAAATGTGPGTPQRIGMSAGAKVTAVNSAAAPGAAESTGTGPGTPQRIGMSTGAKVTAANSAAAPGAPTLKRSSSKTHGSANIQTFSKNDVIPVIVPRTNLRVELGSDSRKENGTGRTLPYNVQSKFSDFRQLSNIRDDSDRIDTFIQSGFMGNKNFESNEVLDQDFQSTGSGVDPPLGAGEHNLGDVKRSVTGKLGASLLTEPSTSYNHESYNFRAHKPRETCSVEVLKGGKTRSLVASWERRERSPNYESPTPSSSSETITATDVSYSLRGRSQFVEKETISANDEDAIIDLMERHKQFLDSAETRLTKLQVVHELWERNDLRGLINAVEKMSDHAVSADVISIWTEKSDNVSLDICSGLLPVLTSLLESKMDRDFLGDAVEACQNLRPRNLLNFISCSIRWCGPSSRAEAGAVQLMLHRAGKGQA
ncbi:katanin p80 WD40 repeat-containing subunit B1 homolog KTN80.4-like isoform X2 [Phoenix dactylifera]|uniref:Katanin p80 WD40 repeat-containing subunit B1 homolog n=1 Tax=Phoenix dactylifera TaxID=42345 RepID=A0A8B8ZHY4_PHODC|nr:katanin p80 WD40 repeat-containing subunit B1 homolog KTN80.4-like isoform X2 [Phoenix dactylifera]